MSEHVFYDANGNEVPEGSARSAWQFRRGDKKRIDAFLRAAKQRVRNAPQTAEAATAEAESESVEQPEPAEAEAPEPQPQRVGRPRGTK